MRRQLYRIIKVTAASFLKMSTREILVFPILCKRKPIKSQPSLWFFLLPKWRHVDHILQFTTLVEEVGGGFPLSRECSTATSIAETSLLLFPSDSTFPTCEWQKYLGVQGKEKEKQVSALSPCLILIAPGTGQLQINGPFLADYSSHSSQYLALLWSVGYGNTKTRNSNSFISFTNFSSLKVVLFIFTLHLYFEGVLLKCIFLADNNLALCSHLPHLDPFSSEPSASFSHDCFLQWAHLLCHVIPFSQFSINHPCGKHVAGCNACCSPLVPQLLHFLSQILEVHLDLF